jgi:hypothetical protein
MKAKNLDQQRMGHPTKPIDGSRTTYQAIISQTNDALVGLYEWVFIRASSMRSQYTSQLYIIGALIIYLGSHQ